MRPQACTEGSEASWSAEASFRTSFKIIPFDNAGCFFSTLLRLQKAPYFSHRFH